MGLMDFFQRRIHTAHTRSADDWPPTPEIEEQWERVRAWRRRYENNKEELLMWNETWNVDRDRRDLYTPIPYAREMARLSAALLFAAPPTITHPSYQQQLDDILKINGFNAFIHETAEPVAIEGRGAFRVGFHPDVANGELPNITFIRDDQIIWHRYDRFMLGGTVVIETPLDDGRVYRLLETHGAGWIERNLFEGDDRRLGKPIALSDAVVEEHFPDYVDMPPYKQTGLNVPCLVEWSNVPSSASDIAGNEINLDRLDEGESLLLDKARKSVPVTLADESMVEGTSFQAPGVVFLKSAGYLPEDGNPFVETIQPGFDVAAHLEWISHVQEQILTTSGYSPATYGKGNQFDGGYTSGKVLKLKQTRTLLHKAGKDHMAVEAMKTALAVALAYTNSAADIEPFKPEIVLANGMPEDPIENAQQIQLEDTASAISLAEKIRVIRPHWSEERVAEEVEAKKKEDQETLEQEAEQQITVAEATAPPEPPTAAQSGDGSAQAKSGSNPKNPKARGRSGDSSSGPARKDQR